MADQAKFKQFIDELQNAVERGNLPGGILDTARNMITVGGDMVNSHAVIGDHNVFNYYQQSAVAAETDEHSLVVEALDAYRRDLGKKIINVSETPYPGLPAYRLEDASRFFGRKQVVAELLTELQHRQVTWLHGRSGTGKSSLIQAGLMPALLEKNALPIWVRSFDESPATALKKTLLKRHWSGNLKLSAESLLQFLSRLDHALGGQQIYIFFDQFEEFIIRMPQAEQQEFSRELADCLADASLPVHFIFSLRSDYFGETAILRERLQSGVGGEYLLRSLKLEEARQVIIAPLERFGISYQDGLVDSILDHLGGAEIASPQLQLVCGKLFHALPANERQITFDLYRRLGETKGIITDYLKMALRDPQLIPTDHFKAATYILSSLVTLDGRRDIKQVSDWYDDERLRLMAFGWRVDKGQLPAPDSLPAAQLIDPATVASFIEQIKTYVSIQGEDLRQIVEDMLKGYVRKARISFVDAVLRSLRDSRLLHEIQSDDGELSYELIHDYLVAEVMGWLDEDEKNARQLRNKLNQLQLDFNQHKFLLERKELEIISSQIDNPKLVLQDSDKRLLLLSAAAHGNGKHWLALSRSNGLGWLREACWDEGLPENVRQGAAALLGEVDDRGTFEKLLGEIERSDQSAKKGRWLDLLTHYLNRSTIDIRIPWSVKLAVFWRQAGLRIKDGLDQRKRMRLVSVFIFMLSEIIVFITVLIKNSSEGKGTHIFTYILFLILGSMVAVIFSEIMTSLTLILRGKGWGWRVPVLIITGSILGAGLFTLLTGQSIVLWFVGGIIGLVLAWFPDGLYGKSELQHTSFALISSVVVFVTSLMVLNQVVVENRDPLIFMGAAFSAALFAGLYIYLFGGNTEISQVAS